MTYNLVTTNVRINIVYLSVENDGDQIEDKHSRSIIERFIQGTESTDTGLGLAIIAEIVRLSKGTINLERSPITKFTICLPKKNS